MAKKKEIKDNDKKKFEYSNEIIGIIYILISIIGILGPKMGLVGKIVSSFAVFLVGVLYNPLLILILLVGIYLIIKRKFPNFFNLRMIGFYVFVIGILTFMHMDYITQTSAKGMVIFQETINNFMAATKNIAVVDGGGIIGAITSYLMVLLFSIDGSKIVSITLLIIGGLLFLNISIVDSYKFISKKIKEKVNKQKEVKKDKKEIINNHLENETEATVITVSNIEEKEITPKEMTEQIITDANVSKANTIYHLPSLNLLDNPKKTIDSLNKDLVKNNIIILEQTLTNFDIVGKVVEVHIGPTVTQYELEIKAGTKVNKIVSLNKELALALACKDVRIQAPIPGKSTIGIELANKNSTPVTLKEVLTVVPPLNKNGHLTVALGKNIMGQAIYYDLSKAPHLLVAGSTGSGKSVCINGIIISLLMRTKPDEVKIVLVDPKKVELSGYNGVPHLLTPVVTDPKKASVALINIVNEMEKRYDLFSQHNVKNITGYNEYVDFKNGKNNDNEIKKLPYIVVIIDELADLMLVAAKEVEDSIMRIAQMARAAGIHMIVATQRPSTDVITGVVKANIPSRLSFSVSSSIDSRTILDMSGAEKLLGKGDMLFSPMGENEATRIQGCYVSDNEIKKVVDYVCMEQKASYDENILKDSKKEDSYDTGYDNSNDKYDDPLYNEIVEFAISVGKISASLIQRKYRLGYNRAARIVDLLEERGIISGSNGSKPREVLIKNEEE